MIEVKGKGEMEAWYLVGPLAERGPAELASVDSPKRTIA